METTRSFAAFAAAVLSAAALTAQVDIGAAAPAIEFDAVLHAPAGVKTLGDLRGHAVLVEFWATWCGPCRAQMPHMKELHAKYAGRGLCVLGVDYGEAAAVVEPFVQKNELDYVIGIDAANKAGKAYGVNGIPHAFLLDPDGIVTWAGHPSRLREGDLERALVAAKPFGPKLDAQLANVQELLEQLHKGRAIAQLQAHLQAGKLDDKLQEFARTTLARLQDEATSTLARAELQSMDGDRVAAAMTLLRVIEQFEGHEAAKTASERLAQLDKGEHGAHAVELGKQLQQASALLRAGKLDEAQAVFEPIARCDAPTAVELAQRGLAAIAARRPAK